MASLLIANAYVPGDAIIERKSEQQCDLEMFDRLNSIQLPLSKYSSIESGSLSSQVLFPHTADHLQGFIQALLPNGRLLIKEPVLTKALGAIPASVTKLPGIPRRMTEELLTDLSLAGFLRPTVVHTTVLKDTDAITALLRAWGSSVDAAQSNASLLTGCMALVEVEAWKPDYEIGAVSSLKLRLKKQQVAPTEAATNETGNGAVKSLGTGIWQVNLADDDTQDLIDEEDLLDEEDRVQRPDAESLQRPAGDCSTKKKACKNCSCGRAELEAKQSADNGAVVVSTDKVVSSCGSCYLGDAFRCSSCPYLGMPAFKPGEQVQVPANFLKE